jgi:hypothetical protein
MEITRSSVEGATAKETAEWFTGDVYIDTVAVPTAPSRVQRRQCRHEPGVADQLCSTRRDYVNPCILRAHSAASNSVPSATPATESRGRKVRAGCCPGL